jgi:hypothetical protein
MLVPPTTPFLRPRVSHEQAHRVNMFSEMKTGDRRLSSLAGLKSDLSLHYGSDTISIKSISSDTQFTALHLKAGSCR